MYKTNNPDYSNLIEQGVRTRIKKSRLKKELFKIGVWLLIFTVVFLIYKSVYAQPVVTVTNWNAPYKGKIHQLPKDLNKYTCKNLERLVYKGYLKFCEEKTQRITPPGEARVGGEYFTASSTILMEYKARNDNRVHELLHDLLACGRKSEEELCVRQTQKFLLELDLIKMN